MRDAKALPSDFAKTLSQESNFRCSSSNILKYLYCWTKLIISKPVLKTLSVLRNQAFRKCTILDLFALMYIFPSYTPFMQTIQ